MHFELESPISQCEPLSFPPTSIVSDCFTIGFLSTWSIFPDLFPPPTESNKCVSITALRCLSVWGATRASHVHCKMCLFYCCLSTRLNKSGHSPPANFPRAQNVTIVSRIHFSDSSVGAAIRDSYIHCKNALYQIDRMWPFSYHLFLLPTEYNDYNSNLPLSFFNRSRYPCLVHLL